MTKAHTHFRHASLGRSNTQASSGSYMDIEGFDMDKRLTETIRCDGVWDLLKKTRDENIEETLEALEEMLALLDNRILDYNGLTGAWRGDVIILHKAAQLHHRKHLIFKHIGKNEKAEKEISTAKRYLAHALKIAPHDFLAVRELADLYFQEEQYEKANLLFAHAYKLKKEEPEQQERLVYKMIQCQMGLKDMDTAEELCRIGISTAERQGRHNNKIESQLILILKSDQRGSPEDHKEAERISSALSQRTMKRQANPFTGTAHLQAG